MKIVSLILMVGCFFAGSSFAAEDLADHIRPGYSDEEIVCLEKASEIDPGNFGVYYGLGMAYYRKGEFEKVVDCHRKFTQLFDSPRAYRKLERVYRKIGDSSKAQEYSRKAEAYERQNGLPSSPVSSMIKDSREAEALAKLLQINPGIGALYADLEGTEIPQKEDLATEIGLLQKALALDPGNFGIYYGLGVAYFRHEEYNKAIEHCLKFTQANPGCGLTFYALGVAYYNTGDSVSALEQANQLRRASRPELAEKLEALISGTSYRGESEKKQEQNSQSLRNFFKELRERLPEDDVQKE